MSPCRECGLMPRNGGEPRYCEDGPCLCECHDGDARHNMTMSQCEAYDKMEARAVAAEARLEALVVECEGSLTDSDPGNALYRIRKAVRRAREADIKTPRKKSETRKVLQTLAEEVRDMARHAANCAPLHREDPVTLIEKIDLDGFVNTALDILTD